jgi:hypothetical protein
MAQVVGGLVDSEIRNYQMCLAPVEHQALGSIGLSYRGYHTVTTELPLMPEFASGYFVLNNMQKDGQHDGLIFS